MTQRRFGVDPRVVVGYTGPRVRSNRTGNVSGNRRDYYTTVEVLGGS